MTNITLVPYLGRSFTGLQFCLIYNLDLFFLFFVQFRFEKKIKTSLICCSQVMLHEHSQSLAISQVVSGHRKLSSCAEV